MELERNEFLVQGHRGKASRSVFFFIDKSVGPPLVPQLLFLLLPFVSPSFFSPLLLSLCAVFFFLFFLLLAEDFSLVVRRVGAGDV